MKIKIKANKQIKLTWYNLIQNMQRVMVNKRSAWYPDLHIFSTASAGFCYLFSGVYTIPDVNLCTVFFFFFNFDQSNSGQLNIHFSVLSDKLRLNTKLSPQRCWWWPKFQVVGEKKPTLKATLSGAECFSVNGQQYKQKYSALRWVAV